MKASLTKWNENGKCFFYISCNFSELYYRIGWIMGNYGMEELPDNFEITDSLPENMEHCTTNTYVGNSKEIAMEMYYDICFTLRVVLQEHKET